MATSCQNSKAQAANWNGTWVGSWSGSGYYQDNYPFSMAGIMTLTLLDLSNVVTGVSSQSGIYCGDESSDFSLLNYDISAGPLLGSVSNNKINIQLTERILNGSCAGGTIGFSIIGAAVGNVITGAVTEASSGGVTFTGTVFLLTAPASTNKVVVPVRHPNGVVDMIFFGVVSNNYAFQASTNLANWLSLYNFSCSNAPVIVSDTTETNLSQNFYRVVPFPDGTNCITPFPGLVSWWPAANNALDVVGTNNGTLENRATYAPGIDGNAFLLGGVDDYVEVGNNSSLNMSNTFSFEGWIYPTGVGSGSGGYGGIIINREGEYEVARFADGTIRWAFANTRPGWNWINSGFVAPTNQWSHIAVVYSAGIVNTYGNGVLVQTYNGSGAIGASEVGENDFRIGGRQIGTQYFQGELDEISVYNSILTSSEIASIYLSGSAGKCLP
jgi:hypothetical protein